MAQTNIISSRRFSSLVNSTNSVPRSQSQTPHFLKQNAALVN